MIEVMKKNAKRKLDRFEKMKKELDDKHGGNEEKFTYHGGFDLGYVTGQISELENHIEDLDLLEINQQSLVRVAKNCKFDLQSLYNESGGYWVVELQSGKIGFRNEKPRRHNTYKSVFHFEEVMDIKSIILAS
jgi:hypothetical protein